MIRRRIAVCLALVSIFTACGDSGGDSGKEKAELVGAQALSTHYLELAFKETPAGAYLEPSNYQILGEDGSPLTVLAARVSPDGDAIVLETDAQQQAGYKLASKTLGIGSVGFTGSSKEEPFLESVISLSTTQLLVSFSERMDRASAELPAFYSITGPGADPGAGVRVVSARLEDDEKSVVLTTSTQDDALYELSVANVKSRYACDSGALTNMLSSTQNKDTCSAKLRPVDAQGVPARFTVRGRTGIARSGATNPDAAGTTGTVLINGSGMGANTASCGNTTCGLLAGNQDEELIFDFDKPVRADSVIITQADVGYGQATAFVSSSTSPTYGYTISTAELASASIGNTKAYHLAFCPSLPADLMVDSLKLRSAGQKSCTASICLADGVRVDPTRRVANFTGIPTVDTTAPRLLSARSVGTQGVLLSFSEPLEDRAADPVNFVITPDLLVTGATATLHRTQILLSTDAQEAGQAYTLTATSVNDRAGNALATGTRTVSFIGSEEDLHVASAEARSNTELLVTFNAAMDPLTTQNLRSYRFKDPDDSPDIDIAVVAAVASADGKSVTLTTTSQENIQYELSLINIKAQASDNYLDPTRSTVKFWGLPVFDDTAPTVTKAVAVGNNAVLVTFSEPLSNEAADAKNFAITSAVAALSGELTVLGVALTEYGTQALLTVSPFETNVAYTVTVSNVRDRALNAIGSTGNSATFSATALGDSGALPRLVGAVSTSNTKVSVRFSRPMNDTALLKESYWIVQETVNPEVGGLAVVSAAFASGSREVVELTTRSQNEVTYRITVSNVADITGKPLALPTVNSDPRTTLFPGSAPNQLDSADTDGDGIDDNVETRGWVIRITLADGTVVTRQVTSDPGKLGGMTEDETAAAADTDGDGLSDALERRIGSDPRSRDTDGDTLTDYDEFNLVFSNQNAVDTDGDTLDDAAEVDYYKTNALVMDSDGDGFRDDAELFERGRDPRIADLPTHTLSFGALNLALDERYTYTNDSGETVSTDSSTSTSLTVSEALRTLTATGRVFGLEGHVEVGAGDGAEKIPGSYGRYGGSATFETSFNFENESIRASEQAFASSLSKGRVLSQNANVVRELRGATVSVNVTLKNTSDVAYTLSNLEVVMEVASADDVTRLVSVATLVPERTLTTGAPEDLYLGPGQSRGPIRMVSRDVFPNVVQDLMRAPRAVTFNVANYDIVAEGGRNFAFGLQSVREKTMGIFIDSGDGLVKQYQAITAAVLNRDRGDLRCGTYGDRPEMACVIHADKTDDCGNSGPCAGGTIVGGLSNFDGTGRNVGIPVDFVLQDVLQLNRRRQQAALAGPNGRADTLALGDDLQLIARGVTGLDASVQVIAVGPNGVLDSVIAGDDQNPSPSDGITVGADRLVSSIAAGDDVQLIPAGTRGATEDALAIAAGENGVLDTRLRGDDRASVVTGYEVSRTCDAETPFAILVGSDGVRNTTATAPDRQAPVSANPRAPVVLAGPSGFLATVPDPRDVYLAPGVPCSHDADCDGGSAGAGHCAGPQKVVRFQARRDGQYRRFWQLMLPDGVQYQTDFGRLLVRAGDLIGLQFIQDIDRDGLDSQVEFAVGSSDFAADTDGDTLGDFVEVRVGWDVGVVGQSLRRVYSDPRFLDSDGDGLDDLQESDIRVVQCACDATAPTTLAVCPAGQTCADQTPCTSDAQCGAGHQCRNLTTCLDAYLAGEPCDPCEADATRARTDPRRADTDSDDVSDFEEVFGFLAGASVVDVGPTRVILAGPDLRADTLACPANVCSGDSFSRDGKTKHCMLDGDCQTGRRCVHPVACDDVQVVPFGSGVQNERTVVVAPGPRGFRLGGVRSTAAATDVAYTGTRGQRGETSVLDDDLAVVGFGEASSFSPSGMPSGFACVDGSSFAGSSAALTPNRFPMCAIAKPGVDGVIASQPGGDDVVVPAGRGQRVEWTDPLNYDTDMDFARDGIERLLGSSPTDPSDTGLAGDRDRDGLTDNQENGGWTVTVGGIARTVFSNPATMDSDRDGLPDYAERNLRCAQLPVRLCPTNPTNPDTDGDGLRDFDEVSRAELDRLAAFTSFFTGYVIDTSASKAYGTDPSSQDSDGDTLPDGEEITNAKLVVLGNGSTRSVFSSALRADTDGDGLRDDAELTLKVDPTDPDTDDDGRVDGDDYLNGFSASIPDVRVTVHIERINLEKAADDVGDIAFWVLARSPTALARSGLANPTLIARADDVLCGPGETPQADGCFKQHTNAAYPATCKLIDSDDQMTISLQKNAQFVVRAGEYFVVEGMIGEFDGMNSPQGQLNTCNLAPNYLPNYFRSSCYSRFNKVVNYADLTQGTKGEALSIDATDTTTYKGNASDCEFKIVSTITAD